MRTAGPEARIEQVLTQTLETLEARGDAPLTVARCCSELAHEAGLRQDWEVAARLLDRCRETPGLPPAEMTLVLSLAARAWFKAGGLRRREPAQPGRSAPACEADALTRHGL